MQKMPRDAILGKISPQINADLKRKIILLLIKALRA